MPKPKGKLPDHPLAKQELNTPAIHDLSHQRDLRCSPIAHEIVKLLASMEKMPVGSHVTEEESALYMPIVREVMSMLVEKDVKVSDATYIFSLIFQAFELIKNNIDENLNQHMNRVTELVYGLPLNDYNEVTIGKLNDVVIKKDKLLEAWKPILNDESTIDKLVK